MEVLIGFGIIAGLTIMAGVATAFENTKRINELYERIGRLEELLGE